MGWFSKLFGLVDKATYEKELLAAARWREEIDKKMEIMATNVVDHLHTVPNENKINLLESQLIDITSQLAKLKSSMELNTHEIDTNSERDRGLRNRIDMLNVHGPFVGDPDEPSLTPIPPKPDPDPSSVWQGGFWGVIQSVDEKVTRLETEIDPDEWYQSQIWSKITEFETAIAKLIAEIIDIRSDVKGLGYTPEGIPIGAKVDTISDDLYSDHHYDELRLIRTKTIPDIEQRLQELEAMTNSSTPNIDTNGDGVFDGTGGTTTSSRRDADGLRDGYGTPENYDD